METPPASQESSTIQETEAEAFAIEEQLLKNNEGMKPPCTPPPLRRDDDDAKELAPPPLFDASEIDLPPPPPLPSTQTTPTTKLSPLKSVFGIEKAKQRLKAMGIQKKIQMDARSNKLTPKTPKTKTRKDSGGSGSSGKKTISPHEKAQNTINEIEILKREEAERPVLPPPVVHYDESMIHHIQADAVDDGRSLMLPATSSLEAIKGYADVTEKREERRRRRTKPEAYRSGGSSGRRLDFQQRQQRQRRDDRFCGSGGGAGFRNERKSKKRNGRRSIDDRQEGRRKNRRRRSGERSARLQSFVNLPGSQHRPSVFRETEVVRFTKTRPVISFAFNEAAIAARAARKSKAKERKKQKSREKKSAAAAAELDKAAPTAGAEIILEIVAKPVKKKRSSKDSEKRKKKRSQKVEWPVLTPLMFNVDDLIFEEEIVDFPLAKDGFEVAEDTATVEPEVKIEVIVPELEPPELQHIEQEKPPSESTANITEAPAIPPAVASLVDDKSPDTDDYMPNWEEEEEDSSKDDTPTFPLSKIFETAPDQKASAPSSSTIDESSSESIKDGLGTPIFVNPSPPDELIGNLSFESADAAVSIPVAVTKLSITQTQNDDDDSIGESSTTPPPRREPLFGMQVLYEEFLQSMHDDPDVKDVRRDISNTTTPSTIPTPTASASGESGFISSHSTRPSSPSATSSSTTSLSSSSSSTSTPDHSDRPTKKTKKKKKRRKIASSSPKSDEKLPITPDDLKKLRSLQKRRTMLKIIRKQSDGMDEEDRQCLLGLEKLIRAERHMLLRNDAIKRLQETDRILGSDSDDDDNEDNEPSTTPPLAADTAAVAIASPILGIFDTNREAIKLTISNKNHSPVKKMIPLTPAKIAHDEETSCDDQDFTEKLKKIAKEESKSSSESDGEERKKCRALSSSPLRRPSNRSGSRSHRKRKTSPPQSSRSKQRSRKTARRSRRSPPPTRTKRFSRSPPYRPPSPPPESGRGDSASPQQRKSQSCSPTTPLPVLGTYPGWNIARYPQYYINDSYYYPVCGPQRPMPLPPPSNGDHSNSPRARYANPYQNYAQYNLYANEYMAVYQNPVFPTHVATGPHTPPPAVELPQTSPYLTIPVLETSTGAASDANFYGYASDEFEKSPVPALRKSNRSTNGTPQIKEIIQHDDKSGKSSTFAVQKGNVLEIVPAVIVIKQETIDESEILVTATKIEEEPDDNPKQTGNSQKLAVPIGNREGDTKPSVKLPKKRMSWKDEVSRRHVISAVMRLNKETDDSLRGILRSRVNSSVVTPKDKKKVLFADGIPPGQTSSGSSDEEATLKLIRRRLKKKQRRLGNRNKENENMMEKQILDSFIATKVDPELWDAPPPPPPIGSPPANLPQPVLIRPNSPEELLYFHFDPVYSMMYVSPMETPVPPRLLEANGKLAASASKSTTPSENGGSATPPKLTDSTDNSNSPSNDHEDGGTTPPQPPENHDSKSPEWAESHTPPPRLLPTPGSPPQQIQNIVSLRMNTDSPQQTHFSQPPPPSAPCPVLSPFDIQRPLLPSPVMVGYPMFNRARMMAPNMMRGPFNMPPPSQQQQQQQQQHCFNPHIPPPFATSGNSGVAVGLGYHPSSNDCSPTFGMMFNSPQQQQAPPLPPPQQQQQQPLPPQNFMFNIPAHIMISRTNRYSPVPPPPAQFLQSDSSRVESPQLGSPIFRHPLMQQQQILQQPPNDDIVGL